MEDVEARASRPIPPGASRPHRARRLAGVAAANLVGVAVLLVGLEAAVRGLRPEIGPAGSDAGLFLDAAFADRAGTTVGLRPGARGEANGAAVAVDADGFHVYAGNAAAPDSAAWLWLGDSVLFGVGVEADSTVAGRLALAQDTARVLNPAVLGWGPPDYRRRLEAALEDGLRPGRVTLLWCLNDADPGRPQTAAEVGALDDAWRRAKTWLNVHSRLYRLAKDAALDRPARYLAYDGAFYDPLPEAVLEPVWAIRDALAARGVPFEVAVVPYEPQLRPGGGLEAQAALVPRLRAGGVRTLDLSGAFLEAADGDPAPLYLWSDGIHLSARGHAVAARAIARWRP